MGWPSHKGAEFAISTRRLQVQYYWIVPEDVFELWSRPQSAKRGTNHTGLAAHLAQFVLCIPQLVRFRALRDILYVEKGVLRPDDFVAAVAAMHAISAALPTSAGDHRDVGESYCYSG
jgi:hypothetical protein